MLFESLNQIKRQSIMTAIIMATIGVFLVIWPEELVATLMDVVGFIIVVIAVFLIFRYLGGKKSLVDHIWLLVALFLVIVGSIILIFDVDAIYLISWIFGVLLIADGLHSLFHALIFARRAKRKGWGILIPLSVLLLVFGVLLIAHPWWTTPGEIMNVGGWMIVGSAIISALRLIWVWPVKSR